MFQVNRNIIVISVVVVACGFVLAEQTTKESRCFRYTWLGPRFNNESVFLNATCQDATRLADGIPCEAPLVVSYDGTWPDVEYIWRNYALNATCVANNDVCATFTYYFNGQVENSTAMCTRAVNNYGEAITSGCYTQTDGSHVTRVCFCTPIPGGLPCNKAVTICSTTILFLAVILCRLFN